MPILGKKHFKYSKSGWKKYFKAKATGGGKTAKRLALRGAVKGRQFASKQKEYLPSRHEGFGTEWHSKGGNVQPALIYHAKNMPTIQALWVQSEKVFSDRSRTGKPLNPLARQIESTKVPEKVWLVKKSPSDAPLKNYRKQWVVSTYLKKYPKQRKDRRDLAMDLSKILNKRAGTKEWERTPTPKKTPKKSRNGNVMRGIRGTRILIKGWREGQKSKTFKR